MSYNTDLQENNAALEEILETVNNLPESGGNVDLGVTGATVGQTVKISAVDENGVPTAWESVDFPSGGGEENDNDWELINRLTFEEEGITSFKIDTDQNGNSFELSDMRLVSSYSSSLGGTSATSARTNLNINGKLSSYNAGNLTSSSRRFVVIATVINGRIYYGHTDFANNTYANPRVAICPFSENDGTLYNDNSITSVGITILNPGEEYFAVGYQLTLWGRRKK